MAPNHDGICGNNVINSVGALHKFNDIFFDELIENIFAIPKDNLLSVIVGGSIHHYNFSFNEVNNLIRKINIIKKNNPLFNILIIFSRRTTNQIKKIMKDNLKDIIIWDEEDKNPYTFALKYSNFFIVTSDSTSMISECAFTSKPIYIFHLPFKRTSKRIEKFHKEFEHLNITKDLNNTNKLTSWTYKSLNETKRIASIIKERIIKEDQ